MVLDKLRDAFGAVAFYMKVTAEEIPRCSEARFAFMLAGAGIAQIERLVTSIGTDVPAAVRTTPPKLTPKKKVEKPRMYRVLLHNDDYTPHRYVTQILKKIFRLPEARAFSVMRAAEIQGLAFVATYTYEVAETKMDQVIRTAQKDGHAHLSFSIEREPQAGSRKRPGNLRGAPFKKS